jgi:hypothetical protein
VTKRTRKRDHRTIAVDDVYNKVLNKTFLKADIPVGLYL